MDYLIIPSLVGELLLTGDGGLLTGLYFLQGQHAPDVTQDWNLDPRPFADAERQLEEYFAGDRQSFDVTLAPAGTEFQLRVWQELRHIPYGETISYGELARRIGQPDASRAVGLANGANPISILIPCHRVVGTNGKLTGYGGGLENKRLLLDLEASQRRLL